jgi:hypothetical protein
MHNRIERGPTAHQVLLQLLREVVLRVLHLVELSGKPRPIHSRGDDQIHSESIKDNGVYSETPNYVKKDPQIKWGLPPPPVGSGSGSGSSPTNSDGGSSSISGGLMVSENPISFSLWSLCKLCGLCVITVLPKKENYTADIVCPSKSSKIS